MESCYSECVNDAKNILNSLRFLQNNRLGVLATMSPKTNTPEAALMYYAVDEFFHIDLATPKNSRKMRNIPLCEHVAFVIGDETSYQELQIEGVAEILQDVSLKSIIINRISQISNQNPSAFTLPPLTQLSQEKGLEFLRITVTWFKYSDFSVGKIPLITEGTPRDWERALG